MALINCKECGKEVSTEALACPNCGAKQPKKSLKKVLKKVLSLLFIILGGFIALVLIFSDSSLVRAEKYKQASSECSQIGAKAGLNGIGSIEAQLNNGFAITKACMDSRGFKVEFK